MGQGSFIKGLQRLFGARASIDEDFFDDMADTLVEGDLGAKIAYELIDEAKRAYKAGRVTDSRGVLEMVTASISPWVREITLEVEPSAVTTFLVLGVNGVGKTTSVAKMARWYASMHNLRVTMAACDTFRAAAIEQLQRHGESLGLRVIAHQHGSDPGAVVFSACEAARASGGGLVLADTAGRLHNKENLVRELQKIDRIAAAKSDPGQYKKILVLDATTGQNALRQAETFHAAVGVDAVILTKYDSTAKGGIAASVGKELSIPIAFVGTGEGYEDFLAFSRDSYLRDFLGIEGQP